MREDTKLVLWMVIGFLGMMAFVCFAPRVFGADVSFQGYIQPDDVWRVKAGYHGAAPKQESAKVVVDWWRQDKGKKISDGWDLSVKDRVWLFESEYKQIHNSEKKLDTQELSGVATVKGIGLGIAYSWEGKWEDPKLMAKAKYSVEYKAISLTLDWTSNFKDRRGWSASPRIKIPAWKFLSFTLSGKYQENVNNGVKKEWWQVDGGFALDIEKLKEESTR